MVASPTPPACDPVPGYEEVIGVAGAGATGHKSQVAVVTSHRKPWSQFVTISLSHRKSQVTAVPSGATGTFFPERAGMAPHHC